MTDLTAPRMRPAMSRPTLRVSDRGIAAILFLVAMLLRLPFRAQFLVNWDAVNFALGIGQFDLATHQPHPPGYIGWVAIGRVATWLTSDPNAAMTLLSAASGAIATSLVYLLARRFVARRHALWAAGLFGTAPLVWYYSVVALSYMTTGAVALALLLACVVALQERSPRALLAASVLLAVVGALRPTDQVLLLPAWLLTAWAFDWRTRLRATFVMGLASLAWVVPLLWLAGGLAAFAGQGSALADLAGGRTWVLGGNLAGIGQNIGMVAVGLVLGLFGGLAVLVWARARGVRPWGGLPRRLRRLLVAFVAPALAVYLLIHTGQLGYVILLLPAAYVGVARALPQLWGAEATARRSSSTSSVPVTARLSTRVHGTGGSGSGWRRPVIVGIALLAINAAAFLVLPGAGLMVVGSATPLEEAPAASGGAATPAANPALDRIRQYDVRANDAHWKMVIEAVEDFDPDTTAVIAETTSGGSFRHLSYYAEDFEVFGVGWDRHQDVGALFHAREQETNYSVHALAQANRSLLLPPDATTILIPDRAISDLVVDSEVAEFGQFTLADDTMVTVATLSEPAGILFVNPTTIDDADAGTAAGESAGESADQEQAQVVFVSADEVREHRAVPLQGGIIP